MRKAIFTILNVKAGKATSIKPRIKAAVDSVYICQSKSAYAYHSHICKGLAGCTHGITKMSKPRQLKSGIGLVKFVTKYGLFFMN